jgi:hypothetical protein
MVNDNRNLFLYFEFYFCIVIVEKQLNLKFVSFMATNVNYRNKAGGSHNTGYKTRARSNRLGQSCGFKGAAIEKNMRRLIGK